MFMKKPRFDITEVQGLVGARKVRWSTTKAIDPLREEYGSNWKPNGLRILAKLVAGAFHGTLKQNGMEFDVYAVRYDDIGWYVKVSVDDVLDSRGTPTEQLYTISCHPLTGALQTNDGEVKP
jgi:hypothetical protein